MKFLFVFIFIVLVLICSFMFVFVKDFIFIEIFLEWFKIVMLRSIDVIKESDFFFVFVVVKGKVKGEILLVDESEGIWYYYIDIGMFMFVECYVFNEYDGLVNLLYVIVDLSLNGVVELNGKICLV